MVTVCIGTVQAGIGAVIITVNQETVQTIFVDHGKGHQHSGYSIVPDLVNLE